mgnify:CR=1 FL=1
MKKNKNKLNILAFIPARKNSKRIKDKNLKKINGKELIAYPILSALKSKYVNNVFVSTDSKKISDIAKKYNAKVPFLRPKSLATSKSPVIKSIIYSVLKLEKIYNYFPDYILTIQPTSPFITTDLINKSIKSLLKNKVDSLVGLTEVDTTSHPFNVRVIGNDKNVKFWKAHKHYKSLKIKPPQFYRAGGIYLSSRDTIIRNKKIEGKKNGFILMDKLSSIDIDTYEDLNLAAKLMK